MMKMPFCSLSLALVLGVAAPSFGQNCKFDTEKEDPFTGGMERTSDRKIGPYRDHSKLILEQKGNTYFVSVVSTVYNAVNTRISKGDALMLKLEDGTVLKLEADRDYPPKVNMTGNIIESEILIRAELTLAQLQQLAGSALKATRYQFNGADLSVTDIAGRQARDIQETAACLYSLRKK